MLLKLVLTVLLLQCNILVINCDKKSSATCSEAVMTVLEINNCSCTQTRELGAKPNLSCEKPAEPDMFKDMFKILSAFLSKDEHQFGKFKITNQVKFELGENYFGHITFDELYLGTENTTSMITRIHPNAFKGPISKTVKILMINSEGLGDNSDFFKSLLKLKNLKELTVEGRHLTHIPRLAFCESIKKKESSFPLLESIRFHTIEESGMIFIRSIGPRAFWNLPSLRFVSIESQDIRKVGVRSFGLPDHAKTDRPLKIDLSYQWNVNFTADSFLEETFADLNRPVELSLYGNPNIDHLPEKAFRKFFEQNPDNRIRLGQLMDCDCKMLWLYKNPQFKKQLLSWSFDDPKEDKYLLECRTGGLLWDLKEEHFKKCHDDKKHDKKQHVEL